MVQKRSRQIANRSLLERQSTALSGNCKSQSESQRIMLQVRLPDSQSLTRRCWCFFPHVLVDAPKITSVRPTNPSHSPKQLYFSTTFHRQSEKGLFKAYLRSTSYPFKRSVARHTTKPKHTHTHTRRGRCSELYHESVEV